jgi:hypothetical protein
LPFYVSFETRHLSENLLDDIQIAGDFTKELIFQLFHCNLLEYMIRLWPLQMIIVWFVAPCNTFQKILRKPPDRVAAGEGDRLGK